MNIQTPNGVADCYFVHPSSGTAPGVLVWTDIYGLRTSFRQMGKRLAEEGYSVSVMNPFDRVKKAPTSENGAAKPVEHVLPISEHLSNATHRADATAFIEWLDAQPPVAKGRIAWAPSHASTAADW